MKSLIRESILHGIDSIQSIQRGASYYEEYNKLRKHEFSKNSDIRNIVDKKLNSLLTYCYDDVPFYRSLWSDNNISPDLFKDQNSLSKFPVVSKDMVRINFPNKIVNGSLKSRAYYDGTSGSTGKPLEFYVDKYSEPFRVASYMFFNTWMGVEAFDSHWNPKIVLPMNWQRSLWLWLIQKKLYSIMDFDQSHINEILDLITKFKPSYIESYTASIVKLASLFDKNDIELKYNPKAIIATSETLLPSQRELMERVFGCKVYNRYGSREFSGAIAQECSEFNGLHVNPFLTHVEIVDDNNMEVSEGETGRVLVTDLNNYVMPFIRYEIGDIAVKGATDNSCGHEFPSILDVKGRTGAYLIDKNGEKIPLEGIVTVMIMWKNVPFIYEYQFVQKQKGEVTLKIVPSKQFTKETEENLKNEFEKLVKDFEFELEVVSEIKPQKTGKTPFLISSVEGGIPES